MEVQLIVPLYVTWTNKLLRERVNMELKLLSAFGHAVSEVLFATILSSNCNFVTI